jgi:oligopeptide transport system substrate-binding protein
MHLRVRPLATSVPLCSALTLLAVALLALSACGGGSSSASSSPAATGSPVKGGTLVATYQGEPQGLDPAIDWEGQGWAIEHCLFNTFLQYAAKPGTAGTEMLPDLATEVPTQENGGIADGGTTYTFHLKQGVKFAPPVDREVTAADFKYSFERMMADPKAPATGFYTGVVGAEAFMAGKAKHIAGYQTPDPYTVVIKLEQPDMAFMGAMTMSFTDVVAREWVEKWGRQINRHPLGTGPYMFDHWTAGREILVQRNPNYYAPDTVYLDAVRFEFSLNPSTAVLKLQRGDVNVLGDYIPPADYVRVKTDPKFSKLVVEEPVIAIDYLFLNRTVKPFDDLKVRQAISMAIDRTRIIKLLSGAADPLTQLYPAGLQGHQDGAAGESYPYDVAKAKSLLAEAGFPDGFKTTLYSHNVDPWPKVLQSVQQDLREIGITSDLKVLDRATYWTLIGKPGECGVGLNDWWMDFPDPSDFIIPLYSKSSAIEEGTNPSFWWDPQVETLIAEAQANTDPAARIDQFVQIQDDIMAQAPSVPLYQPKVNSMHTADVGNFFLHPVWIFDYPAYYFTTAQ